jgi:hypothetical protein
MPTLHRTIALAQVQHMTMGIGQDLYLDMARLNEGALKQQAAIAKRRLCLGLG